MKINYALSETLVETFHTERLFWRCPMQPDALTMQPDASTMQADALTMQPDALT
ncbi:hypothetical protein [Tolypothrix sp. VBCCA 56010]|uniref:hypothetical protein n=1 Tax=Tolypothrix sp. VBCCA 56010 TaxID=3137731 RepID=UPI003D7CBCD9